MVKYIFTEFHTRPKYLSKEQRQNKDIFKKKKNLEEPLIKENSRYLGRGRKIIPDGREKRKMKCKKKYW